MNYLCSNQAVLVLRIWIHVSWILTGKALIKTVATMHVHSIYYHTENADISNLSGMALRNVSNSYLYCSRMALLWSSG